MQLERWRTPQPYEEVVMAMDRHLETMDQGGDEAIWFLEHPSIYTHGVLAPDSSSHTLPYVLSARGGKMTHHGPGQRVIYSMINLKSRSMGLSDFLRHLQRWLEAVFKNLGLELTYGPDAPGFWHAKGKVVSIGLAVRKGKTFHGLSINVCNDLSPFAGIDPCGVKGGQTTSLAHIGCLIDLLTLDDLLIQHCPFFSHLKPATLTEHL